MENTHYLFIEQKVKHSTPGQSVMSVAKGIFCLEGLWSNDLTQKSTVLPMLEMLAVNGCTKFIHHHSATPGEFEFYLKQWKSGRYRNYPILYFAFHGEKGVLKIGEQWYSFDDLGKLLKNACSNAIVVLASCRTMDVSRISLESFLKETDALALFGYRKMVNWVTAAACEMLLLSSLQQARFTSRGITFEENRIKIFKAFYSNLGFYMIAQNNVRLERLFTKDITGNRRQAGQ